MSALLLMPTLALILASDAIAADGKAVTLAGLAAMTGIIAVIILRRGKDSPNLLFQAG
jgi:hypothetical protein